MVDAEEVLLQEGRVWMGGDVIVAAEGNYHPCGRGPIPRVPADIRLVPLLVPDRKRSVV